MSSSTSDIISLKCDKIYPVLTLLNDETIELIIWYLSVSALLRA